MRQAAVCWALTLHGGLCTVQCSHRFLSKYCRPSLHISLGSPSHPLRIKKEIGPNKRALADMRDGV